MSQLRIANHVERMQLSAIMQMSIRAAQIPDAASLAWGVPSFKTPEYIRRAVTDALENDPDIGKYTLVDGLPGLKQDVAAMHYELTGVQPDPDRHIVITAGNMEGINALLHALVDAGDEVIVHDPGFVSHVQQIHLCGGHAVPWPLDESRGWALDFDALDDIVNERTRAIILVNPANPTGTLFSREELLRLGDVARDHDLVILLDDPYSPFTYENRGRFFTLASVEELRDRVIYLFTFSKAFAMTGWRVGYMVAPDALKSAVSKVHNATMICAPRISQIAAIAALSEGADHLHDTEQALAARRTLICERLDRLPHVFQYQKPDGAYYVFPRIVKEHENSLQFCLELLEQAHVALTPGHAFGMRGEHHVRMAYCVDEAVINTAFDRVEELFPA